MPKLDARRLRSLHCSVSTTGYIYAYSCIVLHDTRLDLLTLSEILAGPLPRFDGISVDNTPAAPEPSAASPPPGASGPIRVPPLQPDDVNKFVSLFDKSGASNGIMPGMYI